MAFWIEVFYEIIGLSHVENFQLYESYNFLQGGGAVYPWSTMPVCSAPPLAHAEKTFDSLHELILLAPSLVPYEKFVPHKGNSFFNKQLGEWEPLYNML